MKRKRQMRNAMTMSVCKHGRICAKNATPSLKPESHGRIPTLKALPHSPKKMRTPTLTPKAYKIAGRVLTTPGSDLARLADLLNFTRKIFLQLTLVKANSAIAHS
jgi:hypothetical protein